MAKVTRDEARAKVPSNLQKVFDELVDDYMFYAYFDCIGFTSTGHRNPPTSSNSDISWPGLILDITGDGPDLWADISGGCHSLVG